MSERLVALVDVEVAALRSGASMEDVVRTARQELGLSKVDLAASIGVSPSVIALVEYGGRCSPASQTRILAFVRRAVMPGAAGRRGLPTSTRERDDGLIARVEAVHAELVAVQADVVSAMRYGDMASFRNARQRQTNLLKRHVALLRHWVAARHALKTSDGADDPDANAGERG